MKIITLLLALLLVNCAVPTQDEKGETDLFVSLSAPQLNFLDFPLFIESIELISDEGKKIQVTGALTVNLANLRETNLLIARHKNIVPGTYTRLRVNLKFNSYSDVVLWGDSGTLYTEKLRTSSGLVLGQGKDRLTIDTQLLSNNGKLVVKEGHSAHLHIGFNLVDMISAREGENGILLELRPILSAKEYSIDNHLTMRGSVKDFTEGKLGIRSAFVSNDVKVGTETLNKVTLDNEKLEKISRDNLVDKNVVASIVIDNKGTINVKQLALFSEETNFFKGTITKVDKSSIKVLGNNYGSSQYTNSRNVYLTLSADKLAYPIDKLRDKMPFALDLSSYQFSKSEQLKGPSFSGVRLFGPDNYM
ncbi:MAG: hypothetical protein OXE99_15520, partial [Cellvibrionales bacterium]|nr:hypothetical protein [Cellvibrionales bacterium]